MLVLFIGGPANGKWLNAGNYPSHFLRTYRIPVNNPLIEQFVPKPGFETASVPSFPCAEYYLSTIAIDQYKEYVYLYSDLMSKNPLEVLLQGYRP